MTHKHSWVVIAVLIALMAGMSPGAMADQTGPIPAFVGTSTDVIGLLPDPAGQWLPDPAFSGELIAEDGTFVTTAIFDISLAIISQNGAATFGNVIAAGGIEAGSTIDGVQIVVEAQASSPTNIDLSVDLFFNGITLNTPLNAINEPSTGLEVLVPYSSGVNATRTVGGATFNMALGGGPDNADNLPVGGMFEVLSADDLSWVYTVAGATPGDTVSIDKVTIEVWFTPPPPGVSTFVSNGDGTFTLTFNQAVINVTSDDFGIVLIPDAVGPGTVTLITGADGDSVYVVDVTGITGDGAFAVTVNVSNIRALDDDQLLGAAKTSNLQNVGAGPGLSSLQVPFFQE